MEEELPLFCYPRGSRITRRKRHEIPIPECYAFVVKNERGDEVHVSSLSFEEPLAQIKWEQLQNWSRRRQRTCMSHRLYWDQQRDRDERQQQQDDDYGHGQQQQMRSSNEQQREAGPVMSSSSSFQPYDEWMAMEQKTICIISRYPFVTAFRRYLRHLHLVSTSYSKIPLERYISVSRVINFLSVYCMIMAMLMSWCVSFSSSLSLFNVHFFSSLHTYISTCCSPSQFQRRAGSRSFCRCAPFQHL
jgi:hypothetical protein